MEEQRSPRQQVTALLSLSTISVPGQELRVLDSTGFLAATFHSAAPDATVPNRLPMSRGLQITLGD